MSDDGPTIQLDIDDAVATITLDRPAALNALTIPMKRELLAALRSVDRDRAVRAVILTGAGRAFCAGQDLRERMEPDAPSLGEELRERYNAIARAMRSLSKPIVGAINGVAAGAGASLAFGCDIRIAAEGVTFVLAFGRLGLIPDTGATWLLPRLVGPSRAVALALLNDPIDATEAERLGIVLKVVPLTSLLDEARAVARRLAESAPIGVAFTKRAMNASFDRDFDAALDFEAALQDLAGASADHREGLAAFLAKRAPTFSGE
ncbi:MAG TPA: enoyl-CoA hydratase-related protein [Candidatus Limnocylindrales bacterium]|nr:enoyl-CoA hydratase-related protein [Candidatus Limnocylindrales bacterium]